MDIQYQSCLGQAVLVLIDIDRLTGVARRNGCSLKIHRVESALLTTKAALGKLHIRKGLVQTVPWRQQLATNFDCVKTNIQRC